MAAVVVVVGLALSVPVLVTCVAHAVVVQSEKAGEFCLRFCKAPIANHSNPTRPKYSIILNMSMKNYSNANHAFNNWHVTLLP